MGLDVISILVGVALAVGVLVLLYTQRERLFALREGAQQQVEATRERLTASMGERYRKAVVDMTNGLHLAGHLIPLEDVAVLPRFFNLPEPFDPSLAEEAAFDISPFSLVPIVLDYPQVLGAYNIKSIPLADLLRGHDDVGLLGTPGSGRTVTLALLALLAAQHSDAAFDKPRLPLVAHLLDLNLSQQAMGHTADPIIPLVEAARVQLKFLAGRALGAVQTEFIEGDGLVLLDGWDELTPEQQQHTAAWLAALRDAYPNNRYVITAGPRGYQPLVEIGFTVVGVMPWNQSNVRELVERWARAWPTITDGAKPSDLDDLITSSRGLPPMDLTLRIWADFAGDMRSDTRPGWFEAYIRRTTLDPAYTPALQQLAMELHEGQATITLKDLTNLLEMASSGANTRPADYLFTISKQTKLLVERRGNCLGFGHPLVRAYLAAQTLTEAPFRHSLTQETLANRTLLPFLASVRDVTEYAAHHLNTPATLSADSVLRLATWMPDAPQDAPWRTEALKRLSGFLMAPSSYPALRERAMAALVASREERAATIFERGLRHPDPQVRILCAIGLGALALPQTIIPLGGALEDANAGVQVAASLALTAFGDRTALNYALQTLVSGSELAQQGIAEMLAANVSGEGHDILRDAVEDDNDQTRRAAVHGLRRIGNVTWVREILEELQRRDDMWFVRAAAEQALAQLDAGPEAMPERPPAPSTLRWLIATVGRMSSDEEAVEHVMSLLHSGDETHQLAAAEMLGALGITEAVPLLYDALANPHPEIRDAAHRALLTISHSHACDLPAPV